LCRYAAVYISMDDRNVNFSKRGGGKGGAVTGWEAGGGGVIGEEGEGVGVEMVHGLQDTQMTLDEKLASSEIQLFRGQRTIKGDDDDYEDDEDNDNSGDDNGYGNTDDDDDDDDREEDAGVRGRRSAEAATGRKRRAAVFTEDGPPREAGDNPYEDADSDDDLGLDKHDGGDDDEEEEEEEDYEDEGLGRGAARWKSTMNAAGAVERSKTLMEMVYEEHAPGAAADRNNDDDDDDDDDDDGDNLFKKKGGEDEDATKRLDAFDRSKFIGEVGLYSC
jgi:ribosome biogenesis protein BMS1